MVISCHVSESVVAGVELDACGASCLACQRQLKDGDNSVGMEIYLRVDERLQQNSFLSRQAVLGANADTLFCAVVHLQSLYLRVVVAISVCSSPGEMVSFDPS